MKLSLIFLSTLLCAFSATTHANESKIYRWVDENGKIHFSDTADAGQPGTNEVVLKTNNLLVDSEQPIKKITADEPVEEITEQVKEKPAIKYQASIISPQDDQPLRSNDGTINIHVSTDPVKENTQTLQLYLDGKKLGSPQMSSTIRAANIDRGTHQVQVTLLDEDGKELAKTQVVTVHLLRATVN